MHRPSLLSDSIPARWLSPSLALALHGAVATAILFGLTFDPPKPDLGTSMMVELVSMAVPEPVAQPAPLPVAPQPEPPTAKPAPRVTAKPVAPLAAPAANTSPMAPAAAPSPMAPAAETSPVAAAATAPSSVAEPAGTAQATAASPPAPAAYVPPVGHAGYLSNPRPSYPSLARKRGWEGVVTLRVDVDSEGNPVAVEVKVSSGHSVLDHCATAAVRQWRFSPARRGNETIAATVEVPIRFDLTEESRTG